MSRYVPDMIHALTIDVEDYHSVGARDWLGRQIPPTRAVADNTRRILAWLSDRRVQGTFFVLGEVAQAFPDLIREMAVGGHEVGIHGFYHRQLFKLDRASFRREVGDAKAIVEDILGRPVEGHRAPAFSIMPSTAWGLEVLADLGFRYDSSIFPIKGRRYGWPGFPLDIHEMSLPGGRTIIEAPMSVVAFLGLRLPACGGGYLRHFPAAYTHWALRRVGRLRPAIVYLHPYEIETTCPAHVDTGSLGAREARRVRRQHAMQLRNRASVETKLLDMLARYPFAPLADVIASRLPNTRACGRPAEAGCVQATVG